VLLGSILPVVFPLLGVVIGGLLTTVGQAFLARGELARKRRVAARLMHAELASLYLAVNVPSTVGALAEARYAEMASAWKEHREVLSTIDRLDWDALWIGMQTLDTFFGMSKGVQRAQTRRGALDAIADATTVLTDYIDDPRKSHWMRTTLK
jgi:hypothetical protein